ncbi:MAG TPA: STAS domain-containing protein [Geodermatophilus sp.]|nr:STAS domain-containing protein [Geodermatophilus sp.]
MTATSIGPPTSDLVSVTVSQIDRAVRLTVTGEVDSSSAGVLHTRIEDALTTDVEELTVDLIGVTFLDSAGLCALATAHRRAGETGVRLRVLAANRAVIRPLQITGLWGLLGVEQVDPGADVA